MRTGWEHGEKDNERDCLQSRTWGPDPRAVLKGTRGHQRKGEECRVLAVLTGHIPVQTTEQNYEVHGYPGIPRLHEHSAAMGLDHFSH